MNCNENTLADAPLFVNERALLEDVHWHATNIWGYAKLIFRRWDLSSPASSNFHPCGLCRASGKSKEIR
jgi:hypothetical protein